MNQPLDDCIHKLRRVEDQLDELKFVMEEYARTRPDPVARKDDVKNGRIVFRLKDVGDPPVRISLIAGEILHNLRCSLDYLICRLAESHVKVAKKSVEFPVCLTPEEFADVKSTKLKDLSGSEIELVERMQPYSQEYPAECSPLYILSALNNLDKHRAIPICHDYVWAGAFTFLAGRAPHFRVEPGPSLPQLKPGEKIATILIQDGMAPDQVFVRLDLPLDVAFGKGCGLKGGPILHVFQTILAIRAYLYQEVFVRPGLLDGFDFDSSTRYLIEPYLRHLPPMPSNP